MSRGTLLGIAVSWAVAGGTIVGLSRGLPAEGFFVGDCGVKLAMMSVAIEHPTTPLDVPLPRIGGRAAPDLLGRFYVRHGDHAHALTSELFPLLSAPFLALLGLRGAYLWPAVGLLGALAFVQLLAARVGRRELAGPAAALLLLGSPLLFYSLEIWEHVPAAALAAGATLLVLGEPETPRRQWWAGLALGFGFLLRPECLWYGCALALHRRRGLATRSARLVGGAALAAAPLVVFHLVHFGRPLGVHLAANAATTLRDWPSLRGPAAEAWLWGARSPLAAVGLSLALCAAAGAWLARRRAPGAAALLRGAGLLGVALAAVAAAQRGLSRDSLWAVFPAALLALLPPAGSDGGWARALRRVCGVFTVLVVATTPNLGGGQYGPRFLLPLCVPLALLASFSLRSFLAAPGVRRVAMAALLVPTLVASLAVQRNSYRGELRLTKRIHARLVDALRQAGDDTRYVLSDLWWLDQLAASEYPRRTFLLAETDGEAREAVTLLAAAGRAPFLIVRSASESPLPAPTASWLQGSCYLPVRKESLEDRALDFTLVRCSSPSTPAASGLD